MWVSSLSPSTFNIDWGLHTSVTPCKRTLNHFVVLLFLIKSFMNVGIKLKNEKCIICILVGHDFNYDYILEACIMCLIFWIFYLCHSIICSYIKAFLYLLKTTDGQLLRALELNSWQILRLLGAHLPGLLCGNPPCGGSGDGNLEINKCDGTIATKLCGLFSKAMAFYDSLKTKTSSSWM